MMLKSMFDLKVVRYEIKRDVLLETADDKSCSVLGFGLMKCGLELFLEVFFDSVDSDAIFLVPLGSKRVLTVGAYFGEEILLRGF